MTMLEFLEELEKQTKKAVEDIEAEYFNGPEKVQAMTNNIVKTMGPMKPFDVCAWVYVLDNISTCLKHQSEYDQNMVNLLREAYGCGTSTVHKGTHKECTDLMNSLFYKTKPK